MSPHDRARRAISFVIAVVCFVLAPQIASATFRGGATATQSVSTASLVTPSGLSGSFECFSGLLTEGITVSFSGFSDTGQPSGVSYRYTILQNGTVRGSTTSTSRTATLTATQTTDLSQTVWTVQVQATLGSWTSGVGTDSATCKRNNNKGGTF